LGGVAGGVWLEGLEVEVALGSKSGKHARRHPLVHLPRLGQIRWMHLNVVKSFRLVEREAGMMSHTEVEPPYPQCFMPGVSGTSEG